MLQVKIKRESGILFLIILDLHTTNKFHQDIFVSLFKYHIAFHSECCNIMKGCYFEKSCIFYLHLVFLDSTFPINDFT